MASAAEPQAVYPTSWAYKDGVRAALNGETLGANPCDPVAEAERHFQWVAGYNGAAPQTTEQAIKQIVADEGLLRLDIGFASYSPSLVQATLWWKDVTTDTGQACAFGYGATIDEAIADAFTTKTARTAELAEAA